VHILAWLPPRLPNPWSSADPCGWGYSTIALAQTWHWQPQTALLQVMHTEAPLPPYYFTLPEIGRHGRMDIPKREQLMAVLRDRGFQVSRTHFAAQAIKTDATLADCIAAARAC